MSKKKSKSASLLYWIVMLFYGILSILFGIWVLNHPAISYIGIAYYLCVMLIIFGAFQMVKSFDNQGARQWGVKFILGVIYIVIGFCLMANIIWAEEILPYILGFMLMYEGLDYIAISGVRDSDDKPIKGWAWYLIFGFLTVLFSFLIIFHPLFGFLNVIVWTGMAFIVSGISVLISFIFGRGVR